MVAWTRHLWKNTFNDFIPLHGFSEIKDFLATLELSKSNAFVPGDDSLSKSFDGAARLFQATQSFFSFSVNQSLDSTPLMETPEKIKQLSNLRSSLPFPGSLRDFELTCWKHLLLTVSWFVSSQEKYFAARVFHHIQGLIEQIYAKLGDSIDPTTVSELLVAFSNSSSQYVLEAKDQLLHPFFDLLLERCSGEASLQASQLAPLGKAWILIGQLLFSSFILLQPVDPSSLAVVASNILDREIKTLEREIFVLKRIEGIKTGSPTSPLIESKENDRKQLEKQSKDVASQIAVRPSLSQIQDLFHDLQQLANGPLKSENIHSLIQSLSQREPTSVPREALFQV